MPIIKSVSDLRNKFTEISDICHKEGEPVFITRKGRGNLVVMSLAKYEPLAARLALFQKLDVAEIQNLSPEGRASHEELMNQLRRRLND